MWTILKKEEVATKLEERAGERREEERHHEKIFSELKDASKKAPPEITDGDVPGTWRLSCAKT